MRHKKQKDKPFPEILSEEQKKTVSGMTNWQRTKWKRDGRKVSRIAFWQMQKHP